MCIGINDKVLWDTGVRSLSGTGVNREQQRQGLFSARGGPADCKGATLDGKSLNLKKQASKKPFPGWAYKKGGRGEVKSNSWAGI